MGSVSTESNYHRLLIYKHDFWLEGNFVNYFKVTLVSVSKGCVKMKQRLADIFRSKKWIVLSVLFVLLIAIIVIISIIAGNINNNKKEYVDNWAFYNYGQTINKQKGESGVDINIVPILEHVSIGNSVSIAVVDSGLDYSCEALKDRVLTNMNDTINGTDDDSNGFVDDYYGWNFYDNDNNIFEDALYDYHGTYVATTIAKVNPNAKILSVKFLRSTSGSSDDAVLAIKYAISRGARIINCSWNFNNPDDNLLNLIKEHQEVLFVFSAGNSNIDIDLDAIYPCSYNLDNTITVMAIDNKGMIYNASGYGKTSVDIAAPGVDVKVTLPEDEETLISGTSVAASYVTGASSLLISKNSNLSPKDIKNILVSTASKKSNLESLCISGGILNISDSIYELKNFQ